MFNDTAYYHFKKQGCISEGKGTWEEEQVVPLLLLPLPPNALTIARRITKRILAQFEDLEPDSTYSMSSSP